jgi:hypothetical protein
VKCPASEPLTIEVPLAFKKRGGRKQMIIPHGKAVPSAPNRSLSAGANESLIRALARAHRWKEMLESESYASITELAEDEKVNRSYLCRVLRLTLLAPHFVQAIVDARPVSLSLAQLLQPFTPEWNQQLSSLADRSAKLIEQQSPRKTPQLGGPPNALTQSGQAERHVSLINSACVPFA